MGRTANIAVIAGDGIGREVTAEALAVLRAIEARFGTPLRLEPLPWSADHYLETGVTLPPGGYDLLRQFDAMEPLSAFAARGFTTDAPLAADTPANLIRLDGAAGPEYWLVFNNFRAITKYNTSRLYATAVHQLAESIAGRDAQLAQSVAQATVPMTTTLPAPATTTEPARATTP